MKKIEEFLTNYKNISKVISGVIIVVTFFIVADDYINSKIEDKITDETYISKLSKTLRPFSIFNAKGVMKYDHGGEKYIKNLEVILNSNNVIEEVKVHSKVFLQNAPIITYNGHDSYAYESQRVDTYIWSFKFSTNELITMNPGHFERMEPILMVEVLR